MIITLKPSGVRLPAWLQRKVKSEKYIVVMLLLAAGLLAGCAHHNDPAEPMKMSGEQISVQTNIGGFMRGNRIASIDNNTTLQNNYDLKIDAYFHDTETKFLNGKKLHYDKLHDPSPAWVFWSGSAQEHYYWPFDGAVYDPDGANITYTSLDFVGYCPFDKPTYIGTPTYAHATGTSFTADVSSYMTSAAQASMQEFIVAVLNAQTLATQTAAGGALPMVFKHPFAIVKFVMAAGSGEHVTVDSIGIADLYTGGTCTCNGLTMAWSSLSGSAALKILPPTPLKYGTASAETVTMLVIPNNYGIKTLSVRASWYDWSVVENQTISADVDFNWQPGYSYTYNLTVTPYALKVDISKYTEQW